MSENQNIDRCPTCRKRKDLGIVCDCSRKEQEDKTAEALKKKSDYIFDLRRRPFTPGIDALIFGETFSFDE